MTVSDIVIVIDCLFTFLWCWWCRCCGAIAELICRLRLIPTLWREKNQWLWNLFFYKNTVVFILTFKVGYISCFDFLQNLQMFFNAVLRSRNYLFSSPTPAPPLSIFLAPDPAPAAAIFCHLKLYRTSITVRNTSQWRFLFILASSKLTAVNFIKI